MMKLTNPLLRVLGAILLKLALVHADTLFFTEIADPKDIYQTRFVELYTPSEAGQVIGQISGKNLYLGRASNTGSDYSAGKIQLTGETIGADGFLVICASKSDFDSIYGDKCDIASSQISGNGNDAYVLYRSVDGSMDEIVDVFGIPGDGGNFYVDSRSEKKAAFGQADAVFDVSHWDITADVNAVDFDPRTWVGAVVSPTPAGSVPSASPSTTTAPSISPSTMACTLIQEIQGNSTISPLVGQNVKICSAWVTSIVYTGFYMQEKNTMVSQYSRGIFVYTGSADKSNIVVGRRAEVYGQIKEYYGMTQISSSSFNLIPGRIRSLKPKTLWLPVKNIDDFEKNEGMYVSVQARRKSDIVISEYYNFDRYGEVVVCEGGSDGRNYQFTEISRPNVTRFEKYSSQIQRSCVTIDDDFSPQNRNPAKFGGIYPVTSSTGHFRGGDVITTLQGPLFFAFNKWRVQPMTEAELAWTGIPRQDPPELPPGDLKVAFANLLNYWVTVGTGSELRGADSAEEFARQSAKTTLALSMIDADVVAVCEMENLDGNLAAQDLKTKLNARFTDASRVYEAATVAAGIDKVGGDVIKVDVFYDTLKLDFLGASVLTDSDVDQSILSQSSGGEIFASKSRSPLAVTFQLKASGKIFTIVSSHYKSKNDYGIDPPGLDKNGNDGAGAWNHLRLLTTLATAEWLSRNPTGIVTDHIIAVGDMNSYLREDPIKAWRNQYRLAIDYTVSPRPYSYLFDGQFGSLDFAFVKRFIVNGGAYWNVNADEPDIIDYNLDYGRDSSIFDETSPARFSDHDPLILSVSFP